MAARDMPRTWPARGPGPSPPGDRRLPPPRAALNLPFMPEPTTLDAESVDLRAHIRGIPVFPKPGILFYDISTLLRHGPAWTAAMRRLGRAVRPHRPDLLAGIESRGFLIAAPLALELGLGFIMLRKRGKLPGETVGLDYALEYGTDRIEMQADAVQPGQRVVVLDDLLATGGTMAAGVQLLRSEEHTSELQSRQYLV